MASIEAIFMRYVEHTVVVYFIYRFSYKTKRAYTKLPSCQPIFFQLNVYFR
jgi:hypothetical protein